MTLNSLDLAPVTEQITSLRGMSQRDSVTPETVGSLLQLLVSRLSTASLNDVAIDNRLSVFINDYNNAKAADFLDQTTFRNNVTNKFTNIEQRFTSVGNSIESSKQSFFRALWNEICSGSWMATDWQNPVGRYNNETGYYELNGLTDITYGEALRIFASWLDGRSQVGRANLPPWRTRGLNHKETNMKESSVESWWGCNSAVSGQTMGTDPGNCGGSSKLKTMRYVNLTNILTGNGDDVGDVRQLDNCPALVHVEFNRIEQSVIWIRSSPNLDHNTLQNLFTKCPAGATIHLHRKVYQHVASNDELSAYVSSHNLTVTSNN